MKIEQKFLTVNPYSRKGTQLAKVQAFVVHWVAKPNATVDSVWDYFEGLKNGIPEKDGKIRFASTQYTIGNDGRILQMMPETEIAWHVGSTKIDEGSGKFYTDLARAKFGQYAIDYKNRSPNSVCIGVEMNHLDWAGKMTDQAIEQLVYLTADVCTRHKLSPETDVLLHRDVVGWKTCHIWFVNNPNAWAEFKKVVDKEMKKLPWSAQDIQKLGA